MSQSLADAIASFTPAALPVWVAYSGGADSTALLLACAEKWPNQVKAIHIHHGLQAAADDFERHCSIFCERHGIALITQRAQAKAAAGQSPEDAARRARYKAFSAVISHYIDVCAIKNIANQTKSINSTAALNSVPSIAIAHHADDQIETLLLALSRGAGLAGLSAMPAAWQRDGLSYHRPLLAVNAADIRLWLAARGLKAGMPLGQGFIEDPTNTDERYTRNRIRAKLLPALEATFPQFRDTFARSAAHAAQAQSLLTDLAQQDWALIASDKRVKNDGGVAAVAPVIAKLQLLPRERQANVLRYWLKADFETVPSTAQLNELLDQVAACITRGHQLHIKVGAGFVRRVATRLDWYNPQVLR